MILARWGARGAAPAPPKSRPPQPSSPRAPPPAILSAVYPPPGAFDVEEFKIASPTFGIAFFLLFILLMFLILMNIFLAILGEAYSMVREEADEAKAARVKTKQRSASQWCRLVYALFKAKRAARKADRDAEQAARTRGR